MATAPKAGTANTGPINPNTGRPFAAGDTIDARNRSAANEFAGWQQANNIAQWNKETQGRIDYANARKSALGQGQPSGGGAKQKTNQPQQPQQQTISYQTGFNAEDQAINQGNVLGRLQAESRTPTPGMTGDGARAAQDQALAQRTNDLAQMRRGLELQNSQEFMKQQIARSELLQAGMANQAQVYSDIMNQATSQANAAAQMQQQIIKSRAALFESLLGSLAR